MIVIASEQMLCINHSIDVNLIIMHFEEVFHILYSTYVEKYVLERGQFL